MTNLAESIRDQVQNAIEANADRAGAVSGPELSGTFPGVKFGPEVFQVPAVKRKEYGRLLDKVIENIHDGEPTDQGTIEQIIGYAIQRTMPKSKKADGAGARWVLQAKSTDETRYVLNWAIYNERDGETVATDGRRMHILKGYHFDRPGVYAWNGIEYKQEMDYGTYPNYQQVIPHYDKADRVESLEDLGPIETGKDAAHDYLVKWKDGREVKARFNARYIAEATNGTESPAFYLVDELTPLVIKSEHRTAIIMPMRRK